MHRSPEDEAARRVPRRGLLGRLDRAFGTFALTVGMAKGVDRLGSAEGTNIADVMLFGEGRNQGREANRGSEHD